LGRTTPKKKLKQKQASAKSKLYSKKLRQTQRLAAQLKSGKLDIKHRQRRKSAKTRFKSSAPHMQYKQKRSTNQFKSSGSIIRSKISAPAVQNKSSSLTATLVRPQIVIEQQPIIPIRPQAIIEQPTMLLPVQVQTQTPIQPAQAVAGPSRVAFRIFAICLTATAVCVNASNYSPLIPTLHSALHINDGQVGLFSTLFFLGIIVANVPGGILADRFGSRPVMLVGLSLTTTGSLLFPVFPNFIWMVACRALIGLGGGAAMVSGSHACAQLGKYEPQAQGLQGGAAQLGVGLGLVSMTFLQGLLGWRDALFVCGILGIVAWLVWLWYPKEVHSLHRADQPAENPALAIRAPAMWMLGLANMGTFGLADAIMAWISVYFINVYGLPLAFAGSLGSAALFAGIFFQPLGGLLLARLQRPVLLIRVGTLMCFLSVVALALPFHWFPLAIVGLILFAIGTTLPFASIFSTASMVGKVSGAGAGISQALVAIMASLAAVTGAPLIGLVLESTSSFTTALGSIGLIFPTIAVTASLFLGFALKPTKYKNLALSVQ
jgi:predicted MFS family arabinose efflux permease